MEHSFGWVQQWLSSARWRPYLEYCDGDAALALDLYEWNLRFAGAVLHDVAHVEIAIRNAFHNVFSQRWHGRDSWLLDPASPIQAPLERKRRGRLVDVNARNRANINDVLSRTHSNNPSVDQIITELTFGFWRHMTDAAHEKTIWIPYLNHAFPKGTSRKEVEYCLSLINTVRNRVSHHEPLFTEHRRSEVKEARAAIVRLENLLLPQLSCHTDATSTIMLTLQSQPK